MKTKSYRKLLSFVLAMALLFGMLPIDTALAVDADSGTAVATAEEASDSGGETDATAETDIGGVTEASESSTADESAEETDESNAVSEEKAVSVTAVAASAVTYDDDGFYTSGSTTYYEPATDSDSDGYYEIDNAGKLFWFAALVNGNTSNMETAVSQDLSANAKLTTNINLNNKAWTPIGNYGSTYKGTFDGGGYTISGLYINSSSDYQGLFGYVNGGTVKNVTVSGSVSSSGQIVGGVVGYIYGGTVSNCCNTGTVTSSYIVVGGVVGSLGGGAIVSGCYNTGSVTGICVNEYAGTGSNVGGVVGYSETESGKIVNCYNTGTISGKSNVGGVIGVGYAAVTYCYNTGTVTGSGYVGGVAGLAHSTITNCYYLEGTASYGIAVVTNTAGIVVDTSDTTSAVVKTEAQFASGEVAYLLNGSTSGGTAWYQNLDNGETVDSYPVLDSSHGTVYRYTSDSSNAYSNYRGGEASHECEYGSDGFCICGAYQPAEQDSDGVYQITNVGNLFWFAALVNGDTLQENVTKAVPGADAALTCDLDLSGYEGYIPIGYTAVDYTNSTFSFTGYSGIFDGQGHTISNLTISNNYVGSLETVGLFGTLSGTVKNLGMESFTFDRNGGSDGRFGAIVGQMITGGYVLNCYVANSTVDGDNRIAGAVAGCNYGGTIENCYIYSCTVTAHSRTGDLVGDNENDGGTLRGTLVNCYSTNDLTGTADSSQTGTVTGGEANVSTARFTSGEVAYLLNGSTDGGTNFYQNIDNGETVDSYPVPESSHGTVYYGYVCGATAAAYTNLRVSSSATSSHSYDDDGFCTNCGTYEPATDSDEDGYYEIDNAGKLFWFAALVNGYTIITTEDGAFTLEGFSEGDLSACAVLTANIDLGVTTDTHTSTAWTPIGDYNSDTSLRYKGTFDGQNHTISGLSINNDSSYQGLFGYIRNGTVKNVTVSGSITVTGKSYYAGGIVGDCNGDVINCTNNCTINGYWHIGGIAGGNSGNVTDCHNTGMVIGTENVGGVIGWNY